MDDVPSVRPERKPLFICSLRMKHRLRIFVIAGSVVVAAGALLSYNYFSSKPRMGDGETVAAVSGKVAGERKATPVEVYIAAMKPIAAGISGLGK